MTSQRTAIPLPQARVVAAKAERVFPGAWQDMLQIHTKKEGVGAMRIDIRPFNPDSGEVLNEPQTIVVDDFDAMLQEVPEARAAWDLWLSAVGAILVWKEQKTKPQPAVLDVRPQGGRDE